MALTGLRPLEVDGARYESFDHRATQAVAAAAHFLEFDGLIVPSAHAPVSNLVIFLDQVVGDTQLVLSRSVPVDWDAWRKASRAP